MGDAPPIHIESKVTTERDRADAGRGGTGLGVSASRVVLEPGRWVAPGPVRPAECLRLYLWYRDPDAVSDGFMRLLVTSPMCGSAERGVGEPEPLTAG